MLPHPTPHPTHPPQRNCKRTAANNNRNRNKSNSTKERKKCKDNNNSNSEAKCFSPSQPRRTKSEHCWAVLSSFAVFQVLPVRKALHFWLTHCKAFLAYLSHDASSVRQTASTLCMHVGECLLMCWITLLNWGTKLWIFFCIHKLWQFFCIHSFHGLWHWIKNCLEQWYLQVFQFYEWCSFLGMGRGGTFMERWALWGSVRVTASNPLINLFH